jgi:hypothetical protein
MGMVLHHANYVKTTRSSWFLVEPSDCQPRHWPNDLETYLDDLPASSQWVFKLGIYSGQDDCVSARIDCIF